MDQQKFEWEAGWGGGISGPTTPGENYFSVAARIEKRKRDQAWKDGDQTSPWPPVDFALITCPTGRGHSDTVAIVLSPSYPSREGEVEAERRAKLMAKAPKMQEFLEWAMGMPPQIWDTLPEDVRERWEELVRSLPR